MAITRLVLAVVLGCLAVHADPIPSLQKLVVGAKNPVGKCPAKDGEQPTYLADASDCTIFYECSGGEAVLKECLPNLCFDTTLNVCAFPPAADNRTTYPVVGAKNPIGKCPTTDGEVPTYLGDSEDCGIFYECSAGQAILLECPPGLCFDLTLNVCRFSPSRAMDARHGKKGDTSIDNFHQVDSSKRSTKNGNKPICTDRPSKPDCGNNRPCDSDDDESEKPCRPNKPCKPDNGDDDEDNRPCRPGGGNKPCKHIRNGGSDDRLTKRGYQLDGAEIVGENNENDSGSDEVEQEEISRKQVYGESLLKIGEHVENDIMNSAHDKGTRGNDVNPSESVTKEGDDDSANKLTKRGNNSGPCDNPDKPCHVDEDHASDHNCPHYPIRPIGKCPKRNCNQGPCDLPKYLPDQDHDDIFYVCSNGRPIQMCCPDDIAAPYNVVGTCPPRDSNVTVYLPDSEDCSIYYVCSNGNAIKNECPPDMAWNNVAHICDWDIDANCTQSGNASLKHLERRSLVPLTAVGTCPPRDSNVTVYLPDSQNCSIYYVCSNGNAIMSDCPPDMSWNNVAHICDWNIDADCKSSSLTRKAYTAVGTCPPRDKLGEPVFLEDSDDCGIYYVCSNGEAILADCSPGLVWNPKLNVCDWAINYSCENKTMSRKVVGTCPTVDPPMPILLPDSESCKLYYECSGGIPFQNECPDDLEFNANLMVCDYALDAGCSIPNNSTTTPKPSQPSDATTVASSTTGAF